MRFWAVYFHFRQSGESPEVFISCRASTELPRTKDRDFDTARFGLLEAICCRPAAWPHSDHSH